MTLRGHYRQINDHLRQTVIKSVMSEGRSKTFTAKRLDLPLSTVNTIITRFEEDGTNSKKPQGAAAHRDGGRTRKMTEEMVDYCHAKLDEMATLTMKRLTDDMNAHFGTNLTSQTVCRHMNHSAKEKRYRLKLCRYEPDDFNSNERIAARRIWCQTQMDSGGLDLADAIFIDEAGFNCHLTRRQGRSRTGSRPLVRRPTQRGRNLTLVVAVGGEGIVATHCQYGGFNGAAFDAFVKEKVLPKLQEDRRRRNIIMDNARIHNRVRRMEILEGSGGRLLFLPPYSPQLDAAEWVFSCVKPYVKQQDLRHRCLEDHVMDGVRRITSSKATGWIREVARNFCLALVGKPLGRMYASKESLQDESEPSRRESLPDESDASEPSL